MFDLKPFRKSKKITQFDVADTIGIQRSRLSNYENGRDRSETISNLLFKHYPEIIEYEIDPGAEEIDFKAMYERGQERIAMFEKQAELYEALIEQFKKNEK